MKEHNDIQQQQKGVNPELAALSGAETRLAEAKCGSCQNRTV